MRSGRWGRVEIKIETTSGSEDEQNGPASPSLKVASDFLSLSRLVSSQVVGHIHLRKHLHRVDIFLVNLLCRMCDWQEETAENLVLTVLQNSKRVICHPWQSGQGRLPATPVVTRPCPQRRGKSHLSIADLKECHKYGRGKPSPSHSPAPSPSPSCSSGRPARKSATKFKRLLEEGLLDSTLDSGSVSSEDEDVAPKSKRRRSISSTSSRKRLNSDSDLSSVGTGIIENSAKYRERRDRNNLSSKRSRQKRKMQQEQKQLELKDLEHQNRKLRRKADALAVVLDKVHKAWKEYLKSMKKD
ncbi:hypothetical protein J6590_062597 [Homalodisca vitripennis]|nr:hypothetical protein J6590_062597 [Homalodisca vitripennis]